MVGLLGGDPPLHQAVAHRQSQGIVAVVIGGGVAVFGESQAEVVFKVFAESLDGGGSECKGRH